MASIVEQLNTISYTRDDFYRIKNEYTFECSDILKSKLDIIKNIIKKNTDTIGSHKSHYSKSHHNSNHSNHSNTNYSGHSINYNTPTKFDKSWRFEKTKIKKENLSDLDEVINKINSLLNKLSKNNFDNITEHVFEKIESHKSEEIINKTIENIFTKAVMQPTYCPMYVKLLNIMDQKYQIIELIDNKCMEYKTIIKEKKKSDDSSMNEQEKYDLFCKLNKEKTYKAGYSQFIGELFKNNMITETTIKSNLVYFIENLGKSIKEEPKGTYVEDVIICLCQLILTIHTKTSNIGDITSKLYVFLDNKEIPKRLYFKILDIKDKIN